MSKFYSLGIIVVCIGTAVFLKSVFSGRIILQQSLHIGFLNIYYYGIILAIAVLVGYTVASARKNKFGFSVELQDKLIFWLILGGFIGARIYHVISEFGLYISNPIQILAIWKGGLSIYGAVFGGMLALRLFVIYYKKYQLNFLKILDWLTPSLLIGQIIGRFGNFFNYELYGLPTNLVFKMFVPLEFRPQSYVQFKYFHPLFLYEILANLLIVFTLLLLERKVKLKNGQLFLSYIILYNSIRFGLEFLRIDAPIYFGIHLNTIVSLGLALGALSLLYWIVYASKISSN